MFILAFYLLVGCSSSCAAFNLTETFQELETEATQEEVLRLVGDVINKSQPTTVGLITDSIYERHIHNRSFIASVGG